MFQLIQFTKEICGDDANQTAADFEFESIGEVIHAVVLRLSSDLPRVKVVRAPIWEEGNRSPR